MSTLSVFVDESGDFGDYEAHAPYYIVSLVFHNQSNCIDENIRILNEHLSMMKFKDHRIHTGPLIRREGVYRDLEIQERRKLFFALFHFTRKCPISYSAILINKKEMPDKDGIVDALSKNIKRLLESSYELIAAFDEVIIYYDNGQVELSRVLSAVASTIPYKFQLKQIEPNECKQYKLSQVADLVCTIELIDIKRQTLGLSKSETLFFGNGRDFKKNYLKHLREKQRE